MNCGPRGVCVPAIVPENVPARPQDSQHLGGDFRLNPRVENRAENRELRYQVEGAIGPGQMARISPAKVGPRQSFPRVRDSLGDQIDSMQIRRDGTPLQKFEQPLAVAASHIGDGGIGKREYAALAEQA